MAFFQRQLGKYLTCWKKKKKRKGERERWECQPLCHKALLLPKAEAGEVPQPYQHFHHSQYSSTEQWSPTAPRAPMKQKLMEKEQSSSTAAEVYSTEPSWNAVPFVSFTFSSICTRRRRRFIGMRRIGTWMLCWVLMAFCSHRLFFPNVISVSSSDKAILAFQ